MFLRIMPLLAVALSLVACESTPERVFTYGALGAEIEAERLVAGLYGLPADPLPYGGAEIDGALAGIKARWPAIRPLLDDGTLGQTLDGDVAVHDAGQRSPEAAHALRTLVKDENRDRYFLYSGVTAGIGHGTDTRSHMIHYTEDVFARQWYRQAPAGWWFRDDFGRWSRKSATARKPAEPVAAGAAAGDGNTRQK